MSKQTKILVVDDHDIATNLDLEGFHKMGFQVVSIEGCRGSLVHSSDREEGEVIVALAVREAVDLVVINLDAREVNGLGLISHFRTSTDIPLVATSARGDGNKDYHKHVLGMGADLFVAQPLPRKHFIKKIRDLLNHRSRAKERVSIAGRVEFSWQGVHYQCGVADISLSGILLATPIAFEQGTAVSMKIFLSGSKIPIAAEGEFVRVATQHEKGIGVKFTSFSSAQHKRLSSFIAEHSSEQVEMIYY